MSIDRQTYEATVRAERMVAIALTDEALAHRLFTMAEQPTTFGRAQREALLYEAARRIRGKS
jgi:hypothetical protein